MSDASATRRAVIDAVLAIVAEEGLAAVSVVAVRTRAGVSNGSVYHHFGTRDGLLRQALVEAYASLVGELAEALDERETQTCVRDLVARLLAWVGAHRGAATVLYLAPLRFPAALGADDTPARKERIARPVTSWFVERAGRRELRSVPVWAVDPVVLAPAHEVARRWVAAPPGDEAAPGPDLVVTVADAVWAIVRPAERG